MKKCALLCVFVSLYVVSADTLHDYLTKKREVDRNIDTIISLRKDLNLLEIPEITPLIGIYGQPYKFVPQFGYVILEPALLEKVLPQTISNQFLKTVGMPYSQMLTQKKIYAQVAFYGNIGKSPQTYNFVCHQFLRWFTKKLIQAQNLLMGIFNPNGIQQVSQGTIAINQLKSENVNIHNGGGLAYSPNNARFSTLANREISTFWSVVFSPDKSTIVITHSVLANTDNAAQRLKKLFSEKVKRGFSEEFLINSLCDLIPALQAIVPEFSNKDDRNALVDASNTIKNVVNARNKQDLSFDFCGLNYHLKLLEYKLEQLKK